MMNSRTFGRFALALAAGAVALGGLAAPAMAQRDPAYASARAAGQVGEKMDGYLGIVGASTPALQAMVNDINIKRRAIYASKAQAANATLEEYAFTSGCLAIAKVAVGEKYQAPDGAWHTRGAEPAVLDGRCPKG
jgi:uncharacterized protein YdbL (DUF1318 family)